MPNHALVFLLTLTLFACGGGGSPAPPGGSGGSGGVAVLGPRPELSDSGAAEHTVLKYLEKAGALPEPVADGWDPTGGLGDFSSFTPTFRVAGSGASHDSVQAAITAAVAEGGPERAYVAVEPGTYREVVCVPAGARPITLYGTGDSPEATEIVFDNYAGKPKESGEPANPCNPNLSGTSFGTSGSATFAAYANGFQAKNLTIANDTDEATVASGTQAVALMTQGDQLVFENVRLLGHQDTLYVKTPNPAVVARVYVLDSYVAGDVDFIFGRASAVLERCRIEFLSNRRGASGGGYLLAPSTDARNPYGILITESELVADSETAGGVVSLGRAWDEGQNDLATYATNVETGVYPNGQALIRDSVIGAHVRLQSPWIASTIDRPFSSEAGAYPANRFYEYRNTGPGAAP